MGAGTSNAAFRTGCVACGTSVEADASSVSASRSVPSHSGDAGQHQPDRTGSHTLAGQRADSATVKQAKEIRASTSSWNDPPLLVVYGTAMAAQSQQIPAVAASGAAASDAGISTAGWPSSAFRMAPSIKEPAFLRLCGCLGTPDGSHPPTVQHGCRGVVRDLEVARPALQAVQRAIVHSGHWRHPPACGDVRERPVQEADAVLQASIGPMDLSTRSAM